MTAAAAARQFAFASTVYRAALGTPPSGRAVFARWPDVLARPWFPHWPYGPLPAGVDWDRVAAALAATRPPRRSYTPGHEPIP